VLPGQFAVRAHPWNAGNAVAGGHRRRARAKGICIDRIDGGKRPVGRPALPEAARQRCLQPAPGGATGVLEHAAPAGIALHHDLVGGVGLIQRGIEPPVRAKLGLRADFDLPAAGAVEAEVEAGGAAGPVGQFVEGRGLEAAARRRIQIQRRRGMEHQTQRGGGGLIAGRAAVVAIAGCDVVVARAEAHRRVAKPGEQLPAIGQGPIGLQVLVAVAHPVALVAPQCALNADGGANEVLVTAAVFAELIQGQARSEGEWAVEQPVAADPARVQPLVGALKVNHATWMGRSCLRCHRNRLELRGGALAAVDGELQGIGRVQTVIPHQPDLRLAHRLAGVELKRHRRCLTRVGIEFGPGEAQRILHIGHVHAVEHHGDAAVSVEPVAELGIQALALGGRMLPHAVGFEAARADLVLQRALGAAELEAQSAHPVAAERSRHIGHRARSRVFGVDADHAT